jgi:hypothetical protein
MDPRRPAQLCRAIIACRKPREIDDDGLARTRSAECERIARP